MLLLLLKLVLVPTLIAGVTLATRRWGPRVGGLLVGLPVVAGPALCFYAVEQGPAFAARAAYGTLLGLMSVAVYAVVYARVCRRLMWAPALLAGWASFLVATAIFYQLEIPPFATLALVAVGCAAATRALPVPRELPPPVPPPWWDLPLRMATAASLVLALTSLAEWLGPGLSGMLAPFPLATATIAAFSHAQLGPEAVIRFFRGFMPALATFGVFCFVLAVTLETLPIWAAIAVALGSQLVIQAVVARFDRE